MRLMVIASSFHPTIGGAETYAHVISEGLAARGHDVTLVTDAPRGGLPGQVIDGDPRGVTVRRLFRYRERLTDPSKVLWEQMAFALAPEISACAEQSRPELIFTNTLDAALAGKWLAVDRGIPWVATFHEHEPEAQPLGHARLRVVHEILRPSLVLACAQNYADRARRHGSADVTRLIPHGVDTARFRPDRDTTRVRRRYGYAEDDLVIACAAQLKPRKGILELIQAFSVIHARRPHTRLLVAGAISSSSGDYPEKLRAEIARHGLDDVARIDSEVTFDLMPDVLATADIVAQPSLGEGLSLAMLEAMSSGRPLLTTDFPGIGELVRDPGSALLVPTPDPGHLADALCTLVSDDSMRRRMGERAREQVLAHFSLQRMVGRTEAALLSTLGSGSQD
ncbi:glycosyltransferase family 4 protein [Streptomyces sp. NEAU-W12]|uniref:glycosyltransferase family 4 protein n=1 Tax=Streptomyces sp. NEAU-W12 TaxID=2994668 RepID=UPI00224A6615|nr:glycosyltransferase family 4 protein [Streptomyces sp. NEAU-W12]MCX2926054.1 glycosyltransferase family 4 protein [Streptomyces sp. NEAU-W12]